MSNFWNSKECNRKTLRRSFVLFREKKKREMKYEEWCKNFHEKSISWVSNKLQVFSFLWIQNDSTAIPIILKMNFPFCSVAHVLLLFFSFALQRLLFVSSFSCSSEFGVFRVAILRAVCESQNPCSHTHATLSFSFSSLPTYVCNSYSCGCATVFGIHQRILPNQRRHYIQFWFFGNPLVMSNRWVKNLCDNSFTHTRTR